MPPSIENFPIDLPDLSSVFVPGEFAGARQSSRDHRIARSLVLHEQNKVLDQFAMICWSSNQGGIADDFRQRSGVRAHDRRAAGHGFQRWPAEALVQRGKQQTVDGIVDLHQRLDVLRFNAEHGVLQSLRDDGFVPGSRRITEPYDPAMHVAETVQLAKDLEACSMILVELAPGDEHE